MASMTESARTAWKAVDPAMMRIAAAVVGSVFLLWGGIRAARVGDARRAELKGVETTLATFADWRRRFEPAAVAESIGWRRTALALQDLGVVGDERLAITQTVGRIAEDAGLQSVRVTIGPADTTGTDERLSTEGVRRQPASFGLVVECRGTLQSVVNFVGQLPPSVAPTALSLVRQDGRARHKLTLAVFELQLPNVPSHDISGFVRRVDTDTAASRSTVSVGLDPFAGDARRTREAVASGSTAPTVRTASADRVLTAILISDDRRVAVIDDAAVSVGDVLRDGARVSAIQPDRVMVVEKNGQWRTLTLKAGAGR